MCQREQKMRNKKNNNFFHRQNICKKMNYFFFQREREKDVLSYFSKCKWIRVVRITKSTLELVTGFDLNKSNSI